VAKPLKFGGLTVAAFGGEMRSDYFKNRAPVRKSQISLARLASLGGQFVLNFRGKNELAILKEEKKIFSYLIPNLVSVFLFLSYNLDRYG